MKDFRQLKVWQKAHELVLALYQITASFPRAENYGLTAQIRRAAASIPSNLAQFLGKYQEIIPDILSIHHPGSHRPQFLSHIPRFYPESFGNTRNRGEASARRGAGKACPRHRPHQ
jgi:hypothetical protein